MGRICPMCSREFENILRHVSIKHNVRSMEEFEAVMTKYKKDEEKKKYFREFIEELNDKLQKNEITIEEYRDQRSRWNGVK